MKAQHTPGPWKHVNGSGDPRPGYLGLKILGPDDKSVAAYSSAGKRPMLEQKANAQLIASAPDLLNLLEFAVDQGNIKYDGRNWRKEAIAAIAKAKGDPA